MEIIEINGEIGYEVEPCDIKNALAVANGKDIDVQVASPGGSVFKGIEIYNAFRDYKRKFPTAQMMLTIKGLAASMASYLAVNPAFDLVAAEDNAVFMIHNAWGGVAGDYRDMLKMAEVLEGLTDMLGDAYSKKTGKQKKEIRKMMDDESWLFGPEILEAGFIDEIIKTPEKKEKPAALTGALLQFKAVSEKIRNENVNYEEIAAMASAEMEIEISAETMNKIEALKAEYLNKLSELHANIPAVNIPPANAGKQEDQPMTLAQFMAENPAAKTELDTMLKAEFEAGKKSMQDLCEKAVVFASSTEYPEQVKTVAFDVMRGKKSLESLETMVAGADMFKELAKSNAAQIDSAAVGFTPGQQTIKVTESGDITSEADFLAELKRAGVN